MNCIVCNNPIEQNIKESSFIYGGFELNGRPKQYCSKNCREFNKFFTAMSKRLDNMSPTYGAKRLLKGQFFKLANTIIIPVSKSNGTKLASAKKD
jgi:hypothetical protein